MTPVDQPCEIVDRYTGTWHADSVQIVVVPGEGESPHSELAMHTRVAGKIPDAVAVVYYSDDNGAVRPRWAYVLTGGSFTDGLYAEVIPWEMRTRLETPAASA